MKSIRTRLLIAAMAVLIGTAVAHSQTAEPVAAPTAGMRGHGFGMGDHMGFLAKQLNLTDEQQTQMKSIMQKEHPAMKPLMQQQRQIDQQLRQYVEGTFDQAKVQALANQKAQLQAQITVQETRIHNEMYQVLTADQQSQLKQLEAQRQERMQQRMNQAPPAAPEQE
ncbi:MAG TPA: Spy/CpxP family protein refolding chaperone [Candidatus Sulfotelmatobacter sp.]|jgi:protein CpxP|nr:Spy/CpxP family protein refolding chaperone [Candidatus Sulfotelmatobacter sp.]